MKCYFSLLTLCLLSVVSRISPPLELTQTCSSFASVSPYAAHFSPASSAVINIHELVCSNWNGPWRPRFLRSGNRSSFFTSCMLLLSGDVEVNPGPGLRHPCGSCSKAVRSTQHGIFCEVCYFWFHTKCIKMPDSEYARLSASDEGWCCQRCFKEALPFSNTSALSCSLDADDLASPSPSSQHDTICPSSLFKIISTNCRSLMPNLDSIRAYAALCKPDVIALCETWLDDTISDCEIFIPDYYTIRRDRNRRGGGVLLYVKECIPTASVLRHPSLELLFVEVTLKHSPLSIGLYYRPPSSDRSLTEFEQFLESLKPNQLKSAMFVGDLNINLLSQSPVSQDILSTMLAFHLHQVVTEPTRVSSSSSSLIDHVYISDSSLVNSCSTTPAIGNSDHLSITTILTRRTVPPQRIRRKMWSYKAANWEQANELLTNSTPSDIPADSDVDVVWASFKSQFLSIMSSCIPSRVVSIKKSLPWLNANIVRILRKRDYLLRLAKNTNSETIRSKYCHFRNLAVSAVRKAKYSFLKSMSSLIRSPKEFWSVYHSLMPKRERIPHNLTNGNITAESLTSKANLLNSYFSSCFTTPSNHASFSTPTASSSSHPKLSTIQCTEEEVEKLLCSLKVKTSTGPDGISSHMLRNTAFSISSPLHKLFNLSLSSGCFPTDWKSSNITPVYKSGNKNLVSNYRPISLLPIPSKVLERIVHDRLLRHLITNSILSPRQFGFRPGSSTQEALLIATHDWLNHLDHGLSSAALFLDMSKAFDKVPHCQLLQSLSAVGVSGPLLEWFKSYLSNRTQKVVLSGFSSTSHPVRSGVPQGSILGPLLFIIYINPLADRHLTPGSSVILYADDILLYRPLTSSHDTVIFQEDVNLISNWILASGLSINPSKSSLLIISRSRKKPQVSVTISGTPVTTAESVRYLGVTITSDLRWNTHISNTCKSAKQKLGLLYRNFHLADQQTLCQLYKTLVLPKLDYCSSVWDPTSSTLVEKLESVQRFAAKLCSKRWSDSPTTLSKALNWPTLHSRRSRQKVMLCRRIFKNESIISPSSYFSPPAHLNSRLYHPHSVRVPFA